jgi:hypothetical protein
MDDTQLIELAYKAFMNGSNLWEDKDMAKRWNPLESDSDALRLAVKLNLLSDARFNHERDVLMFTQSIEKFEATRRAITRAAAEIGKEMK